MQYYSIFFDLTIYLFFQEALHLKGVVIYSSEEIRSMGNLKF